MSWLFSRALVEAFSADGCSAGGACAPWNGTSTPQACCSQGRTTDASNPSPCGTTCRPSTGDPGVDAWTWFLAASPAKTSAPPARAWESKAPEAECGSTWRELWARYDRDTCGWRTHRCLWDEGLDWSSLTLPRWGMMRDGVLWERATPALRIDESGSGCWRTPTVGMLNADRAKDPEYGMRKLANGQTITLADQVKDSRLFATPQARDFRTGGADRWGDPARSRNLNDQVAAMFPTPRTTGLDGGSNSRNAAKARGMWPTPRANKTSDENEDAWMKRHDAGKVATPPLALAVKMFPTPNTRDWKDSGPTQGNRHSPNLGTVVSWPTPTASMITMADVEQAKYAGNKGSNRPTYQEAKQAGPGKGGQLNPDWVELLMGWPLGWTRTDGSRPDMDGWRGAHAGGVPWGEGTAWERGVPRVAAKIPNRVGRLKCIGNGQVPAAMRLAWRMLTEVEANQ